MAEIPNPAHTDQLRPLMPALVVASPRPRYWLHVLLVVLTLFTMLVVGARFEYNYQHALPLASNTDADLDWFPIGWVLRHPANLLLGLPFALALMTILFAHEMGHYFACKRYGVDASLPYFIPAPTLIGTLGAFIRIRSEFGSRRALFDIGIAGPIAGFLFALPVTIVGLALSRPAPGMPQSDLQLGFPLIFRGIYRLLVAAGQQKPATMGELLLHPLAIAGWFGMFATALNLLPGGQLDGGHIVFSFSEKAHRIVSWLTVLALIPLAWFGWPGWLIWAVVLAVSGLRHPRVYSWDYMDTKRCLLLGVAAAMLALCIVPNAIIETNDDFHKSVIGGLHQAEHWVGAHLLRH